MGKILTRKRKICIFWATGLIIAVLFATFFWLLLALESKALDGANTHPSDHQRLGSKQGFKRGEQPKVELDLYPPGRGSVTQNGTKTAKITVSFNKTGRETYWNSVKKFLEGYQQKCGGISNIDGKCAQYDEFGKNGNYFCFILMLQHTEDWQPQKFTKVDFLRYYRVDHIPVTCSLWANFSSVDGQGNTKRPVEGFVKIPVDLAPREGFRRPWSKGCSPAVTGIIDSNMLDDKYEFHQLQCRVWDFSKFKNDRLTVNVDFQHLDELYNVARKPSWTGIDIPTIMSTTKPTLKPTTVPTSKQTTPSTTVRTIKQTTGSTTRQTTPPTTKQTPESTTGPTTKRTTECSDPDYKDSSCKEREPIDSTVESTTQSTNESTTESSTESTEESTRHNIAGYDDYAEAEPVTASDTETSSSLIGLDYATSTASDEHTPTTTDSIDASEAATTTEVSPTSSETKSNTKLVDLVAAELGTDPANHSDPYAWMSASEVAEMGSSTEADTTSQVATTEDEAATTAWTHTSSTQLITTTEQVEDATATVTATDLNPDTTTVKEFAAEDDRDYYSDDKVADTETLESSHPTLPDTTSLIVAKSDGTTKSSNTSKPALETIISGWTQTSSNKVPTPTELVEDTTEIESATTASAVNVEDGRDLFFEDTVVPPTSLEAASLVRSTEYINKPTTLVEEEDFYELTMFTGKE